MRALPRISPASLLFALFLGGCGGSDDPTASSDGPLTGGSGSGIGGTGGGLETGGAGAMTAIAGTGSTLNSGGTGEGTQSGGGSSAAGATGGAVPLAGTGAGASEDGGSGSGGGPTGGATNPGGGSTGRGGTGGALPAGGSGGSSTADGGSSLPPAGGTGNGATGGGNAGGSLPTGGAETGGTSGQSGGSGGVATESGGASGANPDGTGGAGGGVVDPTGLSSCRGVVAVQTNGGVYVGWRLLATDPAELGFNVYRDGARVNDSPILESTNYLDPAGNAGASYTVRPVVDGAEQGDSEGFVALDRNYLAIPLENPSGQAGRLVGTADLDGDCDFDFVVKYSNNDQDVTQAADQGLPNETIKLEAYTNEGALLWRRDLGPNIDTGVWFSPFVLYDLDGDGRAEVALKASEVATSEGGDGDLNGDGTTDYSSSTGEFYAHEHKDVEFLEVWDGATGETRARAPWVDVTPWGSDGYRYNRNLMAPAYLGGSGENPSILIMRGGNERTGIEAYDFDGQTLSRRWQISRDPNGGAYGHNVRIGDIDGDGRDELVYFSAAFDDDATLLWDTGQAHGDRVHMTDLIPDRPGMELFYVQEFADTYTNPISVREAATGELIWGPTENWDDVGRGLAANIDPNSPGVEVWAASGDLYSPTGTSLGGRPSSINMAIWWDGDRERELLDGTNITKHGGGALLNATGCSKGSRETPMGYGDVLGDWREEVWWTCSGDTELRIYVSTDVTDSRLYTPMQDPEYRTSVACMTVGYTQATQTSFYVGSDMAPPPVPRIPIPAGR